MRRPQPHLWGPSGFTAIPQAQQVPDWADFSHRVSSKRVWTQEPPSLGSLREREKFTAVCFGSGTFWVQQELLCPKTPQQGILLAAPTQEQLPKGRWEQKCPQCSGFPAEIQWNLWEKQHHSKFVVRSQGRVVAEGCLSPGLFMALKL